MANKKRELEIKSADKDFLKSDDDDDFWDGWVARVNDDYEGGDCGDSHHKNSWRKRPLRECDRFPDDPWGERINTADKSESK